MATPEDYGINVDQLVESLAGKEGISIDTPHRVTPSTAKSLARRAVLVAFEQLPIPAQPNLPKWGEVVLDKSNTESEERIKTSLTAIDVEAVISRADQIAESPKATAYLQGLAADEPFVITPSDQLEVSRRIEEDIRGTA